SRLFGHPFRKFSHFRSPISEVPAFPVTHFEGSRISGHPFWRNVGTQCVDHFYKMNTPNTP
ncbi:hypothetical protein RhiirA4_468813, partial [Rhizophagus irregularis]